MAVKGEHKFRMSLDTLLNLDDKDARRALEELDKEIQKPRKVKIDIEQAKKDLRTLSEELNTAIINKKAEFGKDELKYDRLLKNVEELAKRQARLTRQLIDSGVALDEIQRITKVATKNTNELTDATKKLTEAESERSKKRGPYKKSSLEQQTKELEKQKKLIQYINESTQKAQKMKDYYEKQAGGIEFDFIPAMKRAIKQAYQEMLEDTKDLNNGLTKRTIINGGVQTEYDIADNILKNRAKMYAAYQELEAVGAKLELSDFDYQEKKLNGVVKKITAIQKEYGKAKKSIDKNEQLTLVDEGSVSTSEKVQQAVKETTETIQEQEVAIEDTGTAAKKTAGKVKDAQQIVQKEVKKTNELLEEQTGLETNLNKKSESVTTKTNSAQEKEVKVAPIVVPEPVGITGITFAGKTPINFQYAVVSADSLIVSNDAYGSVNPNYPPELQPRDRSRLISQAQIISMANQIIPQLLEASPTAQNGSPIIRGDGVVVGGNARSAAIIEAYKTGKADAYEQYIRANASKWGIDANQIPNNPVLVRIANGVQDFVSLSKQLNVSSTTGHSSTETAILNVDAIVNALHKLQVDDSGNLNTAANKDFINAFVGALPEPEKNDMVGADGLLSRNGLVKMQDAIFAAAYDSKNLLENIERVEPESKNVVSALMATAPLAAQIRKNIEDGILHDLGAVSTVLKGIQLYTEAKNKNASVADFINTPTMFEQPYALEDVAIAKFIEGNKRSYKQIQSLFTSIFSNALAAGDPNQISIFGDVPTLENVIRSAFQNYVENTQNDAFNYDRLVGDIALSSAGNGSRSDLRQLRLSSGDQSIVESARMATEALEEEKEAIEAVDDAIEEQENGIKKFPQERIDSEIDRIKNSINAKEIGLDKIADENGLRNAVSEFVQRVVNDSDSGFKLIKADVKELADGIDGVVLKFQSLEDENLKLTQTWIMADGELVLGQIKTTQTFKDKDIFDSNLQQDVAKSRIEVLKSQISGIPNVTQKIINDLNELDTLASKISGKDDVKQFGEKFKIAQNDIRAFKNEYKSLGSIANEAQNAQNKMANAESSIDAKRTTLEKYVDVDGYNKASDALDRMVQASKKYADAQKSIKALNPSVDESAIGQLERDSIEAFREYNAAEKEFATELSNVRANSSFDITISQMKDAQAEIDAANLKLKKFVNVDTSEAVSELDKMTQALEDFNNASNKDAKVKAANQYSDAKSALQKQMQIISEREAQRKALVAAQEKELKEQNNLEEKLKAAEESMSLAKTKRDASMNSAIQFAGVDGYNDTVSAINEMTSALNRYKLEKLKLQAIDKNQDRDAYKKQAEETLKAAEQFSQAETKFNASMKNVRSKDSLSGYINSLKNAETEIESMQFKLDKLNDVDKTSAQQYLSDMSMAKSKWDTAQDDQQKAYAVNKYKEAYSSLRLEIQKLNEEQAAYNRTKKESDAASRGSAKNYYNSILETITKINDINKEIISLQSKDKSSGVFSNSIATLQQNKADLENYLQQLMTLSGQYESGVVGNKVYDFNQSFLTANSGTAGSLLNFLNDLRVQADLTESELNKLVSALNEASTIDVNASNNMLQKFVNSTNIFDELSNLQQRGAITKGSSLYANAESSFVMLKEGLEKLMATQPEVASWSAAQIQYIQSLIDIFEAYGNAAVKAAEKQSQYFNGRKQFSFDDDNVYDYTKKFQSIEDLGSSNSIGTFREQLEIAMKDFTSGTGIVTGFKESADGISTLNFSVLDEATGLLRTFTMEMGTATEAIYLLETTSKNSTYGTDAAQKQLERLSNIITQLRGFGADMDIPAIQRLIDLQDALAGSLSIDNTSKYVGIPDEEYQKYQEDLLSFAKDANVAAAAVEKLMNKYLQYRNLINEGNAIKLGDNIDTSQDIYTQLIDRVYEYSNGVEHMGITIGDFDSKTNSLAFTIANTDGTISSMRATMYGLNGEVAAQEINVKKAQSAWTGFSTKAGNFLKQLLRYTVGFSFTYRFISEIKKGITYVKEIDTAMTELRKVTDETEAAYSKFMENAAKSSSQVGTTMKEFIEASADFARLGYSLSESAELSTAANVYKNVGDDIKDVSTASESIISTMKAFGYEAESAMNIVDKFNEVGNNFAISSAGIGEALTKSASALSAAGNSLDESIGLITAANTIVQDTSAVGTALKTLSLRLRGAKADLEDAGLETDNMCTSVSTLREKLLALTGNKVDIMIDENTFKNSTQILREMATVWNDMSDINQAAALELMGGKRQANILAAIISNFDIVEDVIETSMDSTGSALQENEKYLDSIAGKISLFTNALQQMWTNFINADAVKFIVDLGTKIVKAIDNLGLVKTLLIGIFSKTILSTIGKVIKGWWQWSGAMSSASKALGLADAGIMAQNAALRGSFKLLGTSIKETIEQFAAFMTTPAGFAVAAVAAIAAIVAINAAVRRAEQEAAEDAKTNAQAMQDEKKSLEDYKDQIKELRDELDKGNLSEEDAYNKRQELISIQNDLIDNFGMEKDAINLVTGAINEQIKAIDDLEIASANKWLYENSKSTGLLGLGDSVIDQAKESMNDTDHWFSFTKFGDIEEQFRNIYGTDEDVKDFKEQLVEYFKNLGANVTLDPNQDAKGSGFTAQFSDVDKETLKEYINGVYDFINEYSKKYKGSIDFSSFKNKIGTDLENALGENYETHLSNFNTYLESTAMTLYQTEYGAILNAEEALIDAMKGGDNNEIMSAYNNFIDKINIATEAASEDEWQVQWFNGLNDQYQDAIGLIKFEDAFNNNKLIQRIGRGAKDAINSALKDLDGMNAQEIIQLGDYDGTEQQESAYSTLSKAADEYGLSIEQLIQKLVDFELILSGFESQAAVSFSISDYSDEIDSIQDDINDYKKALDSLNDGSFTFEDFIDLIQKFPELAEGVDTSSKSFKGLAKNLKNAIKSSPKNLIKDLKKLRAQLKEVGGSTEAIDQLIDSMESITDDNVTNLTEKYGKLAESIDAANAAQGELEEALSGDTNNNYKNRAEAFEEIENLLKVGAVGSESKIWDISKAFFGDDPYALSVIAEKDADALAKLYDARKKWYTLDSDNKEYTYEGIESFIKYVAGKKDVLKEFGVTWEYANGVLNVENIPNEQFIEFAHALGLSSEELTDLMSQMGQFFNLNWENAKDYEDKFSAVNKQIEEIASDKTLTAKERLEKLNEVMQESYGIGDVDLTTRPITDLNFETAQQWAAYYTQVIANSKKYTEEYVEWAKKQLEDIKSGSYSETIYPTTYYRSDFGELKPEQQDAAIILTPILPDGTMLSPEQLEEYAQKLLNGEEIDIDGITLGLFEESVYGEDFKEQADIILKYLSMIQNTWIDLNNLVKNDPLELDSTKENAKALLDDLNSIIKNGIEVNGVDLSSREPLEFNKENFKDWFYYYQQVLNAETGKYTEDYVAWAKEQVEAITTGTDYALTYSNTYYKSDFGKLKNGEKDAAVVMTPILPDNTVLSPKQLEEYAQKVLNGEEIDLDITLALFKDGDIKAQASDFVNNLQAMEEEWLALYDFVNGDESALGDSIENAQNMLNQLGKYIQEEFGIGDVDLSVRPIVDFNWDNFKEWAIEYQNVLNHAYDLDEKGKRLYSDSYIEHVKNELAAIREGTESAMLYSTSYKRSDFDGYKKGDEDYSIVLTPVLPDGSVLSPDELDAYAEKIFNGEEIDANITLGVFKGKTFEKDTEDFIEKLQNAEEEWLSLYNLINDLKLFNETNRQDLIDKLNAVGADIKQVVDEAGNETISFNVANLTQLLQSNGYTTENISKILDKLFGGDNTLRDKVKEVTIVSEESKNDQIAKIREIKTHLDELGLASHVLDGGLTLAVDESQLDLLLQSLGYADEEIEALKTKWAAEGLYIGVNTQQVEEADGKIESVPDEKEITVEVNDQASSKIKAIQRYLIDLKDKEIKITTKQITTYTGGSNTDRVVVNGTAHVNGTAYKSGTWGAEKSGTSLVGELGPEMVVRGDKWFTVGDNGTEFANIKKGDIIFNHKQTQSLLNNGYVIGRGKAYAEGTAYASIYGKHKTYTLTGNGVITNADSTSSSDHSNDEAEQTIDFVEYKIEEIENLITNITDKIANFLDDTSQTLQKNAQYDSLVSAEKNKAKTYLDAAELYNKKAAAALQEVPAKYREMAQNGAIAITDFIGENETKTAEKIEKYREWAQKADSAENSYLESIAQISADRLEQLQDIADDFENIVGFIENGSDILQSTMDLISESGERLSESFYQELINNSKEKLSDLQKEKVELQNILDNAVKSGDVAVGSDDWYEMVSAINDVDKSILECQTDIEGFQNDINDLKWDNFDKFIDEIDNVDKQISNLYDVLSDDDKVVDEFGNWTDEGVTSLGLLTQQMETAQYKSEQYGKAIEDLKKDYAAGLYSEDEYNEKLAELTENQWDSIKSYKQAQESIVSLNKTRVDAVKDGMQKEIDAYKELIDAKKEALDADKEARDFEEEVAEKQKDIAKIQKQLAALANDNSASATAKKKQLQADLADAQKDLEDTFYDHSIETQKEALDKEYENYEQNKQDEMDALDEWLKDTNQVVSESIGLVQENADTVLSTIVDTAKTYGVDISNAITSPWKDGVSAISDYKTAFNSISDGFTGQLNDIKKEQQDIENKADTIAKKAIDDVNSNQKTVTSAKKEEPAKTPNPSSTDSQTPSTTKDAPANGATVTVKKTATRFGSKSNNLKMASFVPGGKYTVYSTKDNQVLIGLNGVYTGWVNLTDLEGYAKGTTGVKKNQLAMIDELGDELVLHAGKNGKLEYLTKGTSVIPADLTEKLMDLALDPTNTLEQSRPKLGAPHITTNNFEVNLEFGSLVHVDTCNQDTIPALQKMVRGEFDTMMKQLNNKLYGKVR